MASALARRSPVRNESETESASPEKPPITLLSISAYEAPRAAETAM